MTDLTPLLNELLRHHNACQTAHPTLALLNIDEYLKEAYRIVRQYQVPNLEQQN